MLWQREGERIIKLYFDKNYSLRQIGIKYEVSDTAIRYCLKDRGYKLNSRGGPNCQNKGKIQKYIKENKRELLALYRRLGSAYRVHNAIFDEFLCSLEGFRIQFKKLIGENI